MTIPDDFLLVEDVARKLRFDATAKDWRRATLKWLTRHAVPVYRRGRILLIDPRELRAVLERL